MSSFKQETKHTEGLDTQHVLNNYLNYWLSRIAPLQGNRKSRRPSRHGKGRLREVVGSRVKKGIKLKAYRRCVESGVVDERMPALSRTGSGSHDPFVHPSYGSTGTGTNSMP